MLERLAIGKMVFCYDANSKIVLAENEENEMISTTVADMMFLNGDLSDEKFWIGTMQKGEFILIYRFLWFGIREMLMYMDEIWQIMEFIRQMQPYERKLVAGWCKTGKSLLSFPEN